jgi:hypothetical protein
VDVFDCVLREILGGCTTTIIIIIQFNSFIYVLHNSQIWPITAKHKNNSTG